MTESSLQNRNSRRLVGDTVRDPYAAADQAAPVGQAVLLFEVVVLGSIALPMR
jgi:hypothetical protein